MFTCNWLCKKFVHVNGNGAIVNRYGKVGIANKYDLVVNWEDVMVNSYDLAVNIYATMVNGCNSLTCELQC